ncbi:MAG: ABC transporter substrate-binding protein [Betaproteobacteria bacterium]|nr:ABC transporter substrate-binding protein [Betaproteobacteria bacterium]
MLAAPLRSFAQQPAAKMHRIGFLGPTSAAGIEKRLEGLRVGLREFGYVEGKNLVVEFRWAEGKYDRLPELAAELVRLKVELIVTHATPGSRAAKQATTTIPIVIATVGDAVATGLVASLARPGGNITGLSDFNAGLITKRLQLLREIVPSASCLAVLSNPANPTNPIQLKQSHGAARALGVTLLALEAKTADDVHRPVRDGRGRAHVLRNGKVHRRPVPARRLLRRQNP